MQQSSHFQCKIADTISYFSKTSVLADKVDNTIQCQLE